jgi:membrane protease YdiL (CAAX protease family)
MSRRNGAILLYVIIGYGFTWTVWLPYVAAARRGDPLPSPFLYYVAAFGPLLAAVAAEAVERGPSGIGDLLHRLVDWRRPGRWIAVALLSPLVLPPLAALAVAGARHGWPDWAQFGVTSRAPGLGPFATWLLMTASFGVGEETGWRGFLLPRLQANRSALSATGWLTLIWAGWHLPAFFFREGYVGLGAAGIVGFLLGLAAGAVVLTALYNASDGSILVVALWHGSWNWVATSDGLQGPWVAAMTAINMVAAPVLIWLLGPRNLALRPRPIVSAPAS